MAPAVMPAGRVHLMLAVHRIARVDPIDVPAFIQGEVQARRLVPPGWIEPAGGAALRSDVAHALVPLVRGRGGEGEPRRDVGLRSARTYSL